MALMKLNGTVAHEPMNASGMVNDLLKVQLVDEPTYYKFAHGTAVVQTHVLGSSRSPD